MRVEINNTTYTQINTDEANFLIQNLGADTAFVIFAASAPADDELPTYILAPRDGISSVDINGICWAKTAKNETQDIGVTEG